VKLARILIAGEPFIARLEDGELVPVLHDNGDASWLAWTSDHARSLPALGSSVGLEDGEFLPAVGVPQKILATGLNYLDHASESQLDLPKAPLLFAKTTNTLLGHGSVIRCPTELTTQPDYEAELAVVIGRRASHIEPAQALDHVFAYTIANDVSARDAQFADGQWLRGKSFDTFLPIGPFLVLADSGPDVSNLRITSRLNGITMQDANTGSMIFDIPYLVSYVSRFITLVPGDVLLTGTPSGVGFARDPAVYLRDADQIEIEIEGLGVLRNSVSTASSETAQRVLSHSSEGIE
jgi:2-keto-4-pentenoate hydratase/2-oxohepta-3-ene-1,7-dioic acid hydratase in catechol pathway